MGYRIWEDEGLLRVELTGILRRCDLANCLSELETLERRPQGVPRRLIDSTGVTGSELRAQDFIELAERRRRRIRGPIKAAVIARRPIQVGYARMYQILNDHPEIRIEIFPSEAAAIAWLAAA